MTLLAALINCAYAASTSPLDLEMAELTGDLTTGEGTAAAFLNERPVLRSIFHAGGERAVWRYARMTEPEIDVWELVCAGYTDGRGLPNWSEIGHKLGRRRSTVFTQFERAAGKARALREPEYDSPTLTQRPDVHEVVNDEA